MFQILVLTLCCSWWLSAASVPELISRYAGTWELIPAESDDIERAIETTIAPMNFVARPVARGRLKRRSVAFPSFFITVSESGVRVRHEGGLDVTYGAADVVVQTKAPDGSAVSTRIASEPVLTLSYDAEGGMRQDRYVLAGDGSKLTLAVQMTSARLPKPLGYKLVYRRTGK